MAEKFDPEAHSIEQLDDAVSTKEETSSDSTDIDRDKGNESFREESSILLHENYSEAVCECVCPCETCEEMRSFAEGEDSMHLCVCAEECSEEYFVPADFLCTCDGNQTDNPNEEEQHCSNQQQSMYSFHCCSCGVQLSTMERFPKQPKNITPSNQSNLPNNNNTNGHCACNSPNLPDTNNNPQAGPSNQNIPGPPPPPPPPHIVPAHIAQNPRGYAMPPSVNLLRVLSCEDSSASDTRLHEAARSGRDEDLKKLVQDPELAKNINSRIKPFMSTPLREAVVGGSAPCVKELLQAGAEVDAVDVKGQTALFLAASLEHAHIMQLLLSAGANTEGSRYNNCTPLLICVRDGCLGAVQTLLDHNVDPQPLGMITTCVPGWPLQHSVVYQHFDVFLALLKGGALPSLSDVLSQRAGVDTSALDTSIIQRLSITRTVLRHASECPEFLTVYREFGGVIEPPSSLPEDLTAAPTPAAKALAAAQDEPLSLSSSCRVTLRKTVGAKKLPALAEDVGLPASLRAFLAYKDMDKYASKKIQ